MIEKLKTLSKKQLEIFVRERLGQKDAALCEHNKEHLRLSFHTASSEDVLNNASIVNLFNDVWLTGDHTHSPIILGYKGSVSITSTLTSFKDIYHSNDDLLSELQVNGEGTVEVLTRLIKMYIDERIIIHNGVISIKPKLK
jgi:hypothetical protein